MLETAHEAIFWVSHLCGVQTNWNATDYSIHLEDFIHVPKWFLNQLNQDFTKINIRKMRFAKYDYEKVLHLWEAVQTSIQASKGRKTKPINWLPAANLTIISEKTFLILFYEFQKFFRNKLFVTKCPPPFGALIERQSCRSILKK